MFKWLEALVVAMVIVMAEVVDGWRLAMLMVVVVVVMAEVVSSGGDCGYIE